MHTWGWEKVGWGWDFSFFFSVLISKSQTNCCEGAYPIYFIGVWCGTCQVPLLTFLPWALGNTNQHFSPFSDISNWGVNGYNHKLKCRVMLVYKLTLCIDVCNAHACLCVNQSIAVTFNPWSQVYRGAGRGSMVTSPWCAETQLGSSWHEAESMWWSASSTGRRKTGECQRVWSTVPTFQLLAGPLSFSCVTTLSCTSL